MKILLLAATMLSACPALASQIPTPGKKDVHICDVDYDPNNVVDVLAIVGRNLTIQLNPKDKGIHLALSDTRPDHIVNAINEPTNTVWLKAVKPMDAQPIDIETTQDDGTPRHYSLRWTANPEEVDPPPPASVALASTSNVNVMEIRPGSTDPQKPKPNICYLIRYNFPADIRAAQVAAWRLKHDKDQQNATEIAVHKSGANGNVNKRYVGQGDASIAPTAVFDDGYTTTLQFPGNRQIPVILKRTPDGQDAEVTGFTVEQGGVVKVHEVLPFIRLRDGDLVLSIWNRSFNAIGNNPGTGTTSPDIERAVGAR
jgi:type IV secretion system protein VirB9